MSESAAYTCPLCEAVQPTSKSANVLRHVKEVHKVTIHNMEKKKKIKRVDGVEQQQIGDADSTNSRFTCCGCHVRLDSLSLLKLHFEAEHVENNEEEEPSSLVMPDSLVVPSTIPLSTDSTNNPPSSKQLMQQLQLPVPSSDVAARIIQMLGCKTVSYGNEDDKIRLPFFSCPSVVKRAIEYQEHLPAKAMKITPCVEEELEKENLDLTSDNYVIQNSPYHRHLSVDSFVKLEQDHLDILNTSWERKMYMKAASIQLLSGCIIVTRTQGILVNCIEIYSRIQSFDAHAEKIIANQANSIPTVFSQYPDLCITKLQNDNSNKLVIGTIISNFLITSSIRIDDSHILPEVGPSTNTFDVTKDTKIYLSQNSIKKCNDIIKSKKANLVLKHEIYNLKQIRSNFHRTSTYTFSRGFSLFTHCLDNVPITIFTAQDCRHINNNEVKVVSGILREIAWSMIEGVELRSVDFKRHASMLQPNGNVSVRSSIQSIEKMFATEDHLPVIGNSDLNAVLEILARFVSNNGITAANKKIALIIHNSFLSQ